MVTESLVETLIMASITGAGLIFVAYSIIIPFSDKIKEFRQVKIKEARKKLKKDASTEKLRAALDEIEQSEAIPFYLSTVVYIIFLLYILSVILGLFYLNSVDKIANSNLGQSSLWSFGIATFLFGIMGLSLLSEISEFLRTYMRIKEKK